MKRYHIFVSGKVQGVGFRFRTQLKARTLNIKGWVRNLEDGRVEIIAEGEEEQLGKLLKWIKNQPLFSKVEKVEIHQEPFKREFDSFEIKY